MNTRTPPIQPDNPIDFGGLSDAPQRPNRQLPFQMRILGLNLAAGDMFSGVESFLKGQVPAKETAILYGADSEAISLFLQIERSIVGEKIEAFVLDDAVHRQIDQSYYRSSRSERPINSRFIILQCPEDGNKNAQRVQDAIKLVLRRLWSLINPNSQRELVLVLANVSVDATDVFAMANPLPTLYISGGKTGSGRMGPTVRALAQRAGREISSLNFSDSLRYRRIMNDVGQEAAASSVSWTALNNAADSALVAQAAMVATWFDFIEIHRHPKSQDLLQLPYLDFVLLVRDPRDLLVSQLIYMDQKGGLDMGAAGREKFMLEAIEEEIQFISQEFVAALESPRIFSLRFEDVHLTPRDAYCRLLHWTGWNVPITEEELEHDIRLGSIEYQTGGEFSSGDREFFFAASGGTSPRRGVIGDWQNHFTPKVKDFFKSACGAELIELGYEKDSEW